jgi:hypothetical protein
VLVAVVGLFALLIIGWAVFTLVGQRETVDPEAAEDRIPTHDDAMLDDFEGRLAIVEYRYEEADRRIAGSVVNETDYPVVNVQVEFLVRGLDGDSLTTVRDTTSELAPRETWLFRVDVPGDEAVSEVQPISAQGAQMQVGGADAVTPRRMPPDGQPGESRIERNQ